MNLALTNISYNERLSEETPAYSAIVTLDGKKFCEVTNHGHGACDNQRLFAPFTQDDLKAVCKFLEAQYGTFEPFDGFCHDHLYAHLDSKLRAKQEAQLLKVKADFDKTFFYFKKKGSKTLYGSPIDKRADVLKKFPTAVSVNDMNDADLRKVFCS